VAAQRTSRRGTGSQSQSRRRGGVVHHVAHGRRSGLRPGRRRRGVRERGGRAAGHPRGRGVPELRGARDLESAARGEALEALGAISSLLGAAANGLLRRFDADDGHDADGYASAATWLAGKTHLGRKDDANAAVRRMRLLGRHRPQARGRQVRPEPGRRQAAGRPGLRDPRPGLMLQGVRDRTEFDWRF
jgi:hypothetical protein